jgi:hypothetical protein
MSSNWKNAVDNVVIRHLDWHSIPELELEGDTLHFKVRNAHDTVTGEVREILAISSVRLTFWPGFPVATAWIAAAWAGYVQHEALELVTFKDMRTRPLDPHGPEKFDRGLRAAIPAVLTRETMRRAFLAVMDEEVADELMGLDKT